MAALRTENEDLRAAIEAIRTGVIDGVVAGKPGAEQVYRLFDTDRPYRVLVEGMHEGAATVSDQGVVVYANECFAHMVGRSPAALAGLPAEEVVVEGERAELRMLLALSPGERARVELSLAGPDGPVPVLVASSCLLIGEEIIHCLLATDLTNQKALERILEERVQLRSGELQEANSRLSALNAELEAFAYSVSHDLRAPLRAVHGYSQIILDDHGEDLGEHGRQLFERVMKNAIRMAQLIDDLLTIAQVNRRAYTPLPVDTERVFQAALGQLRETGLATGTTLHVDDLPVVLGDPVLLGQIWTNLLSNAFKFTDGRQGAEIRVEAETSGDEVTFRVVDNGVGFDMAYAHKLFGVFQRLHGQDIPGTGIGLAIVGRAVARMGGRVSADGEVGKGACFSFTLPAGPAIEGAAA